MIKKLNWFFFAWYTYPRTDLCSRHFVFVFCSLFLLISWHTLSQQTIRIGPYAIGRSADQLSPIPPEFPIFYLIASLRAPIWRSPMIIDHATQTGIM